MYSFNKKYWLQLYMFFVLLNVTLLQGVFGGYILYTPVRPGVDNINIVSYLEDVDGTIINSWTHTHDPASMPYLFSYDNQSGFENTLLYYPCQATIPTMITGGTGGRVEIYNWDGELLWYYEMANEIYQHHHDIEVLPNGNILMIAYERKYEQEWNAAGRVSVSNELTLNQMWSTAIFEVKPIFDAENNSGEVSMQAQIIWEWHLWDHLIQDQYSLLDNYGSIENNPQLMDVNCGTVGTNGMPGMDPNGDWMHINAIDYNAELKQIVISSRNMNEIYIIEHSQSSLIASQHLGGLYGKGGDFLYRWGTPSNYYSDSFELDLDDPVNFANMLDTPHGVNWIPEGYPGYGNLILFNNKHNGNNVSAALEITTPINSDGNYYLGTNGVYGPVDYTWVHSDILYSPFQSGAFRQPNGNTLITSAMRGLVFEVDYNGDIVWELDQDSEAVVTIARSEKYAYDYFGDVSLTGDVNNDALINIQDIIGTINIVLGIDEYNNSVDMNSDEIINVQDIILLVNIILNS